MAEADSWKQQLKGPGALSLAIAAGVWIVLLLVVLLGGGGRNASGLARPVPAPPITRPFDHRLQTGSDDLPLDHPRLQRTAAQYEPEQIHLALAGPQAIAVSWSTGNATLQLGQDAASHATPSVGAEKSEVRRCSSCLQLLQSSIPPGDLH